MNFIVTTVSNRWLYVVFLTRHGGSSADVLLILVLGRVVAVWVAVCAAVYVVVCAAEYVAVCVAGCVDGCVARCVARRVAGRVEGCVAGCVARCVAVGLVEPSADVDY